jgi:fatty-acyl-CoA synthase
MAPGDRVATFSWNNTAHMEAYLGIPSMGAIMHTVNIRLSAEHIAYIINHAEDRVLLLDASLIELFAPVLPLLETVENILLVGEGELDTEIAVHDDRSLMAQSPPVTDWPKLDETSAAAVCYTSGTTGNPKGVVYSHRTTFVHSLASRATDTFGISERDRILLLPAMFHANAWGLPYSGWLSGSDFTLPGPHLQPTGIMRMIELERPTITATVPTILGDLLHADVFFTRAAHFQKDKKRKDGIQNEREKHTTNPTQPLRCHCFEELSPLQEELPNAREDNMRQDEHRRQQNH